MGQLGPPKPTFYPRSPEVEPWVFRLIFFPSSPSSSSSSPHHQLFVSIRYRKHQFSNWFDFPGNSSDSYVFLLLLLLFPGVFLSWELSTPVRRTVHRLQAVQWLLLLFSIIQPWAGYITGSLLLFEENRQYSQYKSEFQNNIVNSKIQVLTVQTYNLEITQINAKNQAPD